jgi:predicted NodU family carbamoyl transferase
MCERSVALLEAAALVAAVSAEHLQRWRHAAAASNEAEVAIQEAVLYALHRCLEGLYRLDHE